MKRSCGILMHLSSLPSPYGIGTMGKSAYAFADFLAEAGQSWWQVLPLQPTGYGDSPYQPFSVFAGNPYLIDLELLCEEGLLTPEECNEFDWCGNPERVDYERLFHARLALLEKAFARSGPLSAQMEDFRLENAGWLEDYALYMSMKEKMSLRPWNEWPEEFKLRRRDALERVRAELDTRIRFYIFLQFLFFRQWSALKEYVNSRGIGMIGDMPIYVAMDSADAWANSELFLLNGKKEPVDVAGCPPDGFSATGQVWGNPLYRWEYLRDSGYEWWIRRIRHTSAFYDSTRIDHFRGLESYYAIPAGEATAQNGEWRKGPGVEFFHALHDKLGPISLIAEDLGYLTPEVHALRQEAGYPGMKVLEFAFDSREASNYLPHTYEKNCVVYTGTHDNDTAAGWFTSANQEDVELARQYMNIHPDELGCWSFIRTAYASVADLAIAQMQDFLNLGSDCRMNTPSTLGSNWQWRLSSNALTPELARQIRDLARLYGR